ncbi:FecR domain-containing protein [Marinilongibacter aquaticus]|uniref:FecR family protein n=1 Tax=Marinilongibacter aquaticus TaxID=2975157 RepID=UPI0021BD6B2D|nr:FecR domain-containing protein [Marinilongibacter aquaticus]UBM60868.1 FecR domain-containing protein [Marinilongibacter aquaticus]
MNINEHDFEALLLKFHQGKCNELEIQLILDAIPIYATNPESLYKKLEPNLKAYPDLEQAVKQRIRQRTMEQIEVEERAYPFFVWAKNIRVLPWAAALLLVFGFLSYKVWEYRSPVVVETAYGEQKELHLPDGSLVNLNAHSRIEYFRNWKEQAVRQVKLEGEAFFKVKKYPSLGSKFSVETAGLNVEVLGTEFNVNARKGKTDVYLEEGKVELVLAETQERVAMKPGDFVAYSENTKTLKRSEKIDLTAKSWKSGVVEFSQASLVEILEKVKEIYGLDYTAKEQSNNNFYTMSWPIDNLPLCLEILRNTTGLKLDYNKEINHLTVE